MLAAPAVDPRAFLLNERRSRNPLMPLSIFRVKGLAAADATWLIGMAGFFSMFFFLTLYMQEVLGFSPIQAGAAFLPVTACLALASGVSSQLFVRIGTRPVIVAGALLSAGGIYYLSKIPVHGSYVSDVLPGLVIMALGFGAVFVGVTTAANAGVPPDKAGLAAGLLSTSQQLGMALGLAVLSAIATARTHHLLAAHATRPDALTSGYQRALLACSVLVLAAAADRQPHPQRPHGRAAARRPASPASERKGRSMKYMLQVRFNGADAAIGRLPAAERERISAEFEAILDTPGVLDGNQLQPVSTAATVRVEDGRATVTPGPPLAAGDALDGYYLYDAADLAARSRSPRGFRPHATAAPSRSARSSSDSHGPKVPRPGRGRAVGAWHGPVAVREVPAMFLLLTWHLQSNPRPHGLAVRTPAFHAGDRGFESRWGYAAVLMIQRFAPASSSAGEAV